MTNMLTHLKEGKKEMTAYRLMYEHAEKHSKGGAMGEARIMLHDTVFDLNIEENERGDWKVCVEYEEKTHCID